MKRPITSMVFIAVVLFLVYLWREGGLGDFLAAILGSHSGTSGGGAGGRKIGAGGVGGSIKKAEEERQRRENPNDPVLTDPFPPGTPGTWTPGVLQLSDIYPNAAMLERLRN